jgi:hypothetical protein
VQVHLVLLISSSSLWEYYIVMYENGKMRHVETIPGMGEIGDKGE